MRHLRRGFTLIELLVVITIVVVLLALLAPALDRAVDQAERVACAARLHGWSVSVTQHFLDHRRRLLKAPQHGGAFGGLAGVYLFPNHPRFRRHGGAEEGQFSLDEIGPYVQGPNTGPGDTADHVGKPWYCPASLDRFWYAGEHDRGARDTSSSDATASYSYMFNDYAYWGGAGEPGLAGYATQPQLLTGRTLEPGKLLMSDTLFRDPGNDGWWINHSDNGYSMHFGWGGEPVQTALPAALAISGTNQLFGDGAVNWKDRDRFNPQGMFEWRTQESWLSAHQGPAARDYTNYY